MKDAAPKADIARTNKWLRLQSWPSGPSGCSINATPLYLESGRKDGFNSPQSGGMAYDEYISDPANPVPYVPRPVQAIGYGEHSTWPTWLVSDQRPAAGRPDVLTFISDPLTSLVKIAGQPLAHLIASTSGTDSDWVVKLIDVYPDEVAADPKMGGYQLSSRRTSSVDATARASRIRRRSFCRDRGIVARRPDKLGRILHVGNLQR